MESTFMDDGNFFDQIDDLLEFPPENECIINNNDDDLVVSDDDCKEFPSIWNDYNTKNPNSLFSGFNGNSVSDLSTEISVPYDDIIQLEWLSTFVEDSFSGGGMTLAKDTLLVNKDTLLVNNTSKNTFHTSSPVSVLESSSCSSNSNTSSSNSNNNSSNNGIKTTLPIGPNHRCAQRARSKRPRPAMFSPRSMSSIQLMPSSSSGDAAHYWVSVSDAKKKKPKPKITSLVQKSEPNSNSNNQNMISVTVRKCLHCEITKTPQWRAGPLGPKTLCNACGVRYKSGRLFPEYRPAASPTFVPSIHSNSHKKVVEMRSNLAE